MSIIVTGGAIDADVHLCDATLVFAQWYSYQCVNQDKEKRYVKS